MHFETECAEIHFNSLADFVLRSNEQLRNTLLHYIKQRRNPASKE